jgi:hypothetical protein
VLFLFGNGDEMPTSDEIAAAEEAKAKEAAELKAKADAEAAQKAAEASNAALESSTDDNEAFDKDRAMRTIHNLREIEKQAKKNERELEQLRAEKQKRDEAEMTEAQRLQKQAEELSAKNAKLEADLLRRDVVAEKNLPPILAERLQGTTKEEMLADADKLLKALPLSKAAPKIPATNPNNGNITETEQQKRERLFGRQTNIFDADAIREGGGGVFWGSPSNKETNNKE